MKKNIIFVIIGLILVGLLVTWNWDYQKRLANNPACPTDAMICPDGTPVGRQGKACDFAPCPQTVQQNITVSEPTSGQSIGLPLIVRGTARVFENVLNYRLLDSDGTSLVEGIVTANAPDIGQFGPYEISVNYPKPKGAEGTLEMFSYSAKDGAEINKVSVAVKFAAVESQQVTIYFANRLKDPKFLDCSKVFPVQRRIAKTDGVARAALTELLQGPTVSDVNQGYVSNINNGVAINSLTIEADGIAKVDFSDLLNAGVAGSCRVTAIRSQIERTLKQFPTVKRVEISVNGDSETILQP